MGSNIEGNMGQGHLLEVKHQPLIVSALSHVGIKRVFAGRHSAALSSDGRLFVWGPVFLDATI